MARNRLRIGEHERIVTAFAEPASGPGWANRPILVVIQRRGTNEYRLEYIQPIDQNAEMLTLYPFSGMANRHMTAAVERDVVRERKVS
jgi:hypothetical protein